MLVTANVLYLLVQQDNATSTHIIHGWYIYLHVVDFYGKCR